MRFMWISSQNNHVQRDLLGANRYHAYIYTKFTLNSRRKCARWIHKANAAETRKGYNDAWETVAVNGVLKPIESLHVIVVWKKNLSF